jgi:hypothetical protein
MKKLQAIDTKYNGYRFRSRLEARWAVFFDNLGMKYEYELEGFKLPSGKGYLPDFFLPDLSLFVEVKPTEKISYLELQKMVEFSLDGDHQLLLIAGTPTNEKMYLINRVTTGPLEEYEAEYEGEINSDEIADVFMEQLRDFGNVGIGVVPSSREWLLVYKSLPPNDDHALHSALLAAKQSRFEHGEKG